MANTDSRVQDLDRGPRMPILDHVKDVRTAVVKYRKSVDTLFIIFEAPKRPTVNWYFDGNMSAILDPETNRVVGIMYDHLRSEAIREYPELSVFQHLWAPHLPDFARRNKPTPSFDVAALMRMFLERVGGLVGNSNGRRDLIPA